jgi:hypothetical protein
MPWWHMKTVSRSGSSDGAHSLKRLKGEEARALDARQFVLLRLAHVHDERRLFVPHALGELRRSDVFEAHAFNLPRVRKKYQRAAPEGNRPEQLSL